MGPETAILDLHDPQLYVNRDLSLLAFQERVLEEALDRANPLLERVKFLSIVGSNLDEFFMVRVAGRRAQMAVGAAVADPDRMSPATQLEAIRAHVGGLVTRAWACYHEELRPALDASGIHLRTHESLAGDARAAAERIFHADVFPLLTPLAFDPARPFPHIPNLSLNLAVLLRDDRGAERFGWLKVPDSVPAVVAVGDGGYVWVEDLIAHHLPALFPGMTILDAHTFYVTRDGDLSIAEFEAVDLLEAIQEGIRQRRFGAVVRLQVGVDMPSRLLDILVDRLGITHREVYRVVGPMKLRRLMALHAIDRPDLKDPPLRPVFHPALDIGKRTEGFFDAIARQDILLHHPFESFQHFVDFLWAAARDPDVAAIKMTLYRVGRNSSVVEALLTAAEAGKQVTVVLELRARFDEASNIEWAQELERKGVNVVYGLPGLKVHAKLGLVVRRERGVLRRYCHIATGNYNAVTATLYTDLGLFTANEAIALDVGDVFNVLTGYSVKAQYRRLLVAPVTLRAGLDERIDREIAHARAGRPARLIFKANAVVDAPVIRKLYEASCAGVRIDLIVRGICCLRPGIPGVSDRITVTSVVGRFLEHGRVYWFENGGAPEAWIGSADLMPRNLNQRVEVLCPVEEPAQARRLRDVLDAYLADTVKARRMRPDGRYERRPPNAGLPRFNAQESFLTHARGEVRGDPP